MTLIHDTDHLDAGVPVEHKPAWSSEECVIMELWYWDGYIQAAGSIWRPMDVDPEPQVYQIEPRSTPAEC